MSSEKLNQQASAEDNAEELGLKVFIGNLPFDYNESKIKEEFSGDDFKITSVKIIRRKGYSKGYAFAVYNTKEEAQRAIEALNGKKFEDRVVTLDGARAQDPERLESIRQNRAKPRPVKSPKANNKESSGSKASLLQPRQSDDFDQPGSENAQKVEYDESSHNDDTKGSKKNSRPRRQRKPKEVTESSDNLESEEKPQASFRGGRGRGRGFKRTPKPRPDTYSDNTIYVSNLPYSALSAEELISVVPSDFKNSITHAKIAKKPMIRNKADKDSVAIEDAVELISKGFGFLQFKTKEETTKFIETYGSKEKDHQDIEIKNRKLFIVRATKDLVSESKESEKSNVE